MSDPILASGLRCDNSPRDCQHQLVHVELVDPMRQCFASCGLCAADARKFAANLLMAADLADANKARLEGRLS